MDLKHSVPHHADIYARGHHIEPKILSFWPSLIIITVLQSLALLSSIIRLVHRALIRKLGWDDMWAAVALLSDTALFTAFLALMVPKNPATSAKHLLVFSRWVTLLAYTTALWASRLTISVTITRLLPPCTMRTVSKAASILFGMFFTIMFFQKVFFCGTNWHNQAQCGLSIPRYTGILELVTDNLADLWLVLAPAYMLFQMKLRSVHRRLILAIFTCGLFTILASITHSFFILINSPGWVGVSGEIQVTIAIIVSNLLVIVTALYRALRRRARAANVTTVPSSNDSTTAPSRAPVGSASAAPTTQTGSPITLTEFSDSYANESTTSDARGKKGTVSGESAAKSRLTAPSEARQLPVGCAV